MAAYDRFYKGDIAKEFARGSQEVGGLHTRGGSRELARVSRRARQHQLQGHRGLQAHALGAGPGDAADAEHPRELRPEVDGLQQRALHPHGVPGDEPGVRGSRLLLRRFALPAGGADPRPAVEGLCARAREADHAKTQRSRRAARRSVSVPGRQQSVQGVARQVAHGQSSGRTRRSRISGARLRSPSSIARSGSARPASKPPTRKAGSCRSRRAAAGCLRSSPARPASA